MSGAAGKPTPMMAQYLGLKAEHPDSLLLFRMGDFYETFYEDAEQVAEILGITLTAREKKGDNPIPLAGVPHHALDHYLVKLLDAGRTVAICEQTEDPAAAKGLVRREVVEVISPGTVTNPAHLPGEESRYLLALSVEREGTIGYAILDGSTGEFRCGEGSASEIAGLPRRIPVGEIVVATGHELPSALREAFGDIAVAEASGVLFEERYAQAALEDHFGVSGLAGLGLADRPRAATAAGAALRYLGDRQRRQPSQVRQLHVETRDGVLQLDRETIAHLELFESLRHRDRRATLLGRLDRTRTPLGRRELARWLRAPLATASAIGARQDAIDWLYDHAEILARVREGLRGVGDLERAAGRIATERANPAELHALRAGLERVAELAEELGAEDAEPARALIQASAACGPLLARLRRALVDEPPAHLRSGGVIAEGFDDELDRIVELVRGGRRWIAEFQESERERTGIGSLKVGYNKVFGYHVEVTNPHLAKIPDDYDEKQKLASGKRFITPALKEREREILSAESRRVDREAELFAELRRWAQREGAAALADLVRGVAELDAFASLAEVARQGAWVRPTLEDSRRLYVEAGRHPVVETLVDEPFVPNDLVLDADDEQLLLLTGPNMGGKSTYLRQAALFVVLAQMGSRVPAERAAVGIVDRLFTRVGASDDLARGQSTFLVEMSETANILRNATPKSLVILDEVGRGTSTDDGLALAWAITEYLHDGPARCRTLFATHYHELTALADRLARARNLQMEVREWEGKILFLHTVVEGASDRSYGIHVAQLAGVPQPVLDRARALLEGGAHRAEFEERAAAQLGLFEPRPTSAAPASESEVERRLRSLDPDELTPLQALTLLDELRKSLDTD